MAGETRRSPKVPPINATPQQLALGINMLADGLSDAASRAPVQLALSTAQTVFTESDYPECAYVSEFTTITLKPHNEAAGGTPWWIKSRGQNTFTVGHDASSATRTFQVSIQG